MHNKFKHNYSYEKLDELPGGNYENIIYFPPNNPKDGLIVKVGINGREPWLGVFAFGDWGLSELFSTPDPEKLCVVSKGIAYIVHCRIPSEYLKLPIIPVNGVFQLQDKNLLVFYDFTGIYGWGVNGFVWQTKSLASNEVSIKSVHDGLIDGTAIKYGEPVKFTIDADTGKIISLTPVL